MNATDTAHRSLDAKLDAAGEKIDRLAADDRARLQAQIDALRVRLAEAKARHEAKEEAAERASDAALAELGKAINELYDESMHLGR